jgi:protein-tyrosine-phosphatase
VRILFVCLGNICRSPTAEGVMRRLVADAGLDREVEIESAGTGSWHIGHPPDDRATTAAAARGIELAGEARQVTPDDFGRFDLLVAMDRSNRDALLAMAPDADARRRVFLLREFGSTGTVGSNLRFGREDATDAELWRALEIAQASDFVSQMDGGLDARIAQGGTNVSGGQRQRLAIARAIVHDPRVLVFDDSFSALDLTTDARLRQALWRELPQVTKIVVAQRVSTIIDADRIVVLDDGGVVGLGTHEELLESSQTYREIVESQLGAEVAR